MENEARHLFDRARNLQESLRTISADIDKYIDIRNTAFTAGKVLGFCGLILAPLTFGITAAVSAGAGILITLIIGLVTKLLEKNKYKKAADLWDGFYSELKGSALRETIAQELEKSTNQYVRNAGKALGDNTGIFTAEELFRDRPLAWYIFTGQTFRQLLIWLFQLRERPSVHINRFNEDELQGVIIALHDIANRLQLQLEFK